MKKIKILFADNDPEFLSTRKEILEANGYEVISASGRDEAARLLNDDVFDLAIIDLRLTDDLDEADISGLSLIKNHTSEIPKILLTAYPTVDITRRAMRRDFEDIPVAVDLVSKQENVETLLDSMARAMKNKRDKKFIKRKFTIAIILGVLVVSGILFFLGEKGIKAVIVTILVGIALEIIAVLIIFRVTGIKSS